MKCDRCKMRLRYQYTVTDERGRDWEVYQCPSCGRQQRYAVS